MRELRLQQKWEEMMMMMMGRRMFGEMNVKAEVCRRQHKTITVGGGGGKKQRGVPRKIELYFIKSGRRSLLHGSPPRP
jgi:hypothetical protein